MIRFLFKLIVFLLIAAAIFIAFTLTTHVIIRRNADFIFDSAPKYFIFGASTSNFAYNDSLIDSFVNLSLRGEPYFYTYAKVKEVINQNSSLSALFIDFSNFSIDKENDRRIWDEPNMQYRFPTLASFIPLDAHLLLMRKNIITYIQLTGSSTLGRVKTILINNYRFTHRIGGYEHVNRYLTDSLIATAAALNDSTSLLGSNNNSNLAYYNLKYLEKIIEKCTENSVRVILIRSPLHELQPMLNNELIFKDILTNRFGSVEFIDLVMFDLDNSEYADLGHLNSNGARRFSLWFDNLLKSGLLDEEVNQDEIDKEIDLANSKHWLSN